MTNVTIPLPEDLKELAERTAADRGTSLEQFVRETLERQLRLLSLPWSEDPFFADREVYEGPAPADGAERHDDYIYGDKD
ncbi:MAG TPA: CopG family transcriptional regulator [Thermoanaerobaculia bacterium]|jgi:hypothetical protein|nr:CopG family transcriptional regulator [Thermoanaerobaculia bacterium]